MAGQKLSRLSRANINDIAILEADRIFFCSTPGFRPTDHPGIPDDRYRRPTINNLP